MSAAADLDRDCLQEEVVMGICVLCGSPGGRCARTRIRLMGRKISANCR
jgi:hypothetical protein